MDGQSHHEQAGSHDAELANAGAPHAVAEKVVGALRRFDEIRANR